MPRRPREYGDPSAHDRYIEDISIQVVITDLEQETFMNEFSHKISERGIRPRTRLRLRRRVLLRTMQHQHFRRHHRFGGCDSGAAQDAGRRGRGERIRTVHELHRALASVARTGNEQLRGEAAQIVAEATSQLNGLLAAGR
jgi:hypothetical protein